MPEDVLSPAQIAQIAAIVQAMKGKKGGSGYAEIPNITPIKVGTTGDAGVFVVSGKTGTANGETMKGVSVSKQIATKNGEKEFGRFFLSKEKALEMGRAIIKIAGQL